MLVRRRAVSAIALATALLSATPLLAQTAPAAEADEGLTEIIVTAQKRSQSVQDVPVTVAAISGESLAAGGNKDLFQAVTLVPGVVFSRAADDGLALTFRGLGTSARPQAFEQSVALFTDGVFFGKGRLYSTSFFDVDRMEFIKGTQSTLLGKNASLGAISIVTRQPGKEFAFEARGGYEFEYGGYTVDAAADLPLGDAAALRVAAHYNDYDGWVRNSFTGHDGPQQKDLGLRATLRLDPSDGIRVTASYQYADNQQIGTNTQFVGPMPPGYDNGVLDGEARSFTAATSDGETHHRTRSHIANLKAEFDLGDHVFVSQTAYVRYKLDFLDDFDFTPDDAINFARDEKYKQFTQELRLQSPTGGQFEYMGGLFYLDSKWDSLEGQLWGVQAFPPPPAPISGQLFNGFFYNDFQQDSKAYSAFASGTWRFSDMVRLSGGVRWTREEKDIVYGRTPGALLTIWNTVANPLFDPTPLSHNANFLDGNVSLQIDLSKQVMAYASFGHGSKSGGYVETNTIAIDPALLVGGKVPAALVEAGSRIEDEYTKSYEIGLKTTLLDRRLRLNVAGFWTDIKNFQDTVFTGGPLGFITFNGPARSKGVEVEFAYQPVRELQFNGGLTYADATNVIQPIDAATALPAVDGAGNPVFARYRRSQAPKITVNAGATYTAALADDFDLKLNGSVRHRSSMYNQRQELFRTGALTTVDLGVGVASPDGRWGVDLLAKNVFNEVGEDFASPSVDPRFGPAAYLGAISRRRTVMLSAHIKY